MRHLFFQGKQSYKKRAFYQLFFSFLAVSAVILSITTLFMFWNFERLTVEEINQKSLEMLRQSRSVFSSVHQWMMSSFLRMRISGGVRDLLQEEEVSYAVASKAIEDLDSVVGSNLLLHSVYLYNKRSGRFYSTVRGVEPKGNVSDPALPGLIASIKQNSIYTYFPREISLDMSPQAAAQLSPSTLNSQVLTFVIGDIGYQNRSLGSVIVANLQMKKVRELILDSTSTPEDRLWILERDGSTVSAPPGYNDGDYVNQAVAAYLNTVVAEENEEGTFLGTLGDVKVLISYTSFPETGWYFFSVTPYNKVFSGIAQARNATLLFYFSLVLLSSGGIFIISRRIYRPMSTLFDVVEDLRLQFHEGNQEGKGYESGVDMTIETVRFLSRRLQEFDHERVETLAEESFFRAVAGDKAIEIDGVIFSFPVTLAILAIDHFREIQVHAGGIALRSMVRSLSRIACAAGITCYPVNGVYLVCLLPIHYESVVESIQDEAVRMLGITVTFGLGSRVENISALKRGYKEAMRAVSFRFCHNPGSIIPFCKEMLGEHMGLAGEEELKQFFIAFRDHRPRKAETILEELLDKDTLIQPEQFELLRQLFVFYGVKELMEVEGPDSSMYREVKSLIDRVDFAEDREEFYTAATAMLQTWMELRKERLDTRKEEIVEYIHGRIQSEFQNGSLCSDSIADEVGLSTNYVRDIFRKTCGESISDFINRTRFEYCKTQLQTTHYSVKEIFAEAGFSSYSYGVTAFKKYTGYTPLQYRKRRVI